MAERPKTLEYRNDLFTDLLERAVAIAREDRTAGGVEGRRARDMVATCVAQAFSLTPASFEAKFDEACDCVVAGKLASKTEAALVKRLGQAFVKRDETVARTVLDELDRVLEPSALSRKLPDTSDQAQSARKARKSRKFWQLIGGIIGAWIGAVAGGWPGAALGFKIGFELAGVIYDHTGGGSGSNVIAGPNGEPCTPPFWN